MITPQLAGPFTVGGESLLYGRYSGGVCRAASVGRGLPRSPRLRRTAVASAEAVRPRRAMSRSSYLESTSAGFQAASALRAAARAPPPDTGPPRGRTRGLRK